MKQAGGADASAGTASFRPNNPVWGSKLGCPLACVVNVVFLFPATGINEHDFVQMTMHASDMEWTAPCFIGKFGATLGSARFGAEHLPKIRRSQRKGFLSHTCPLPCPQVTSQPGRGKSRSASSLTKAHLESGAYTTRVYAWRVLGQTTLLFPPHAAQTTGKNNLRSCTARIPTWSE